MTILVVEDDPDTQIILHDYLVTLGQEVLVANGVGEARQHLSVTTPQLLLIDIGLHDGDGVDLATELRLRPELASARMIAVTAYSDPITHERVRSASFDAVLWKPVDGQDLLRAVRSQLALG